MCFAGAGDGPPAGSRVICARVPIAESARWSAPALSVVEALRAALDDLERLDAREQGEIMRILVADLRARRPAVVSIELEPTR